MIHHKLMTASIYKLYKRKRAWSISATGLALVSVIIILKQPLNLTEIPELGEDHIEAPLALPEVSTGDVRTNAEWHDITVEPGMTLTSVLQKIKISAKTINDIMLLGDITQPLASLKPKDKLYVQLDAEGELIGLNYLLSEKDTLNVYLQHNVWHARVERTPIEKRVHYASGYIDSSLMAAGNKAGLSERTMLDLADIFGWDVDFARDLRSGDRFTVIHESHYLEDQKIQGGHIIAAEFINRGKTYQAFRFTHPDGHTDYYRANGENVRTAFLRTPVNYTRISSRFNAKRWHPILHTMRAHKGVDYAAPTGTPVKAAGNGVVSFAGRSGGYGKLIKLKHGKKYQTYYAHLSRYGKKIKPGSRVSQGQIIGYVGMTGLASGAHLHYEFRIDGKQVDPQKVKLPKAKPIDKNLYPEFSAVTQPLAAQLALYGQATEASMTS